MVAMNSKIVCLLVAGLAVVSLAQTQEGQHTLPKRDTEKHLLRAERHDTNQQTGNDGGVMTGGQHDLPLSGERSRIERQAQGQGDKQMIRREDRSVSVSSEEAGSIPVIKNRENRSVLPSLERDDPMSAEMIKRRDDRSVLPSLERDDPMSAEVMKPREDRSVSISSEEAGSIPVIKNRENRSALPSLERDDPMSAEVIKNREDRSALPSLERDDPMSAEVMKRREDRSVSISSEEAIPVIKNRENRSVLPSLERDDPMSAEMMPRHERGTAQASAGGAAPVKPEPASGATASAGKQKRGTATATAGTGSDASKAGATTGDGGATATATVSKRDTAKATAGAGAGEATASAGKPKRDTAQATAGRAGSTPSTGAAASAGAHKRDTAMASTGGNEGSTASATSGKPKRDTSNAGAPTGGATTDVAAAKPKRDTATASAGGSEGSTATASAGKPKRDTAQASTGGSGSAPSTGATASSGAHKRDTATASTGGSEGSTASATSGKPKRDTANAGAPTGGATTDVAAAKPKRDTATASAGGSEGSTAGATAGKPKRDTASATAGVAPTGGDAGATGGASGPTATATAGKPKRDTAQASTGGAGADSSTGATASSGAHKRDTATASAGGSEGTTAGATAGKPKRDTANAGAPTGGATTDVASAKPKRDTATASAGGPEGAAATAEGKPKRQAFGDDERTEPQHDDPVDGEKTLTESSLQDRTPRQTMEDPHKSLNDGGAMPATPLEGAAATGADSSGQHGGGIKHKYAKLQDALIEAEPVGVHGPHTIIQRDTADVDKRQILLATMGNHGARQEREAESASTKKEGTRHVNRIMLATLRDPPEAKAKPSPKEPHVTRVIDTQRHGIGPNVHITSKDDRLQDSPITDSNNIQKNKQQTRMQDHGQIANIHKRESTSWATAETHVVTKTVAPVDDTVAAPNHEVEQRQVPLLTGDKEGEGVRLHDSATPGKVTLNGDKKRTRPSANFFGLLDDDVIKSSERIMKRQAAVVVPIGALAPVEGRSTAHGTRIPLIPVQERTHNSANKLGILSDSPLPSEDSEKIVKRQIALAPGETITPIAGTSESLVVTPIQGVEASGDGGEAHSDANMLGIMHDFVLESDDSVEKRQDPVVVMGRTGVELRDEPIRRSRQAVNSHLNPASPKILSPGVGFGLRKIRQILHPNRKISDDGLTHNLPLSLDA